MAPSAPSRRASGTAHSRPASASSPPSVPPQARAREKARSARTPSPWVRQMAYRVAPPMPSISPSPLMRPKTEMARLRAASPSVPSRWATNRVSARM